MAFRQTPDGPVYRALDMLQNECEPQLRRRAPYWRPRPAPCVRDAYTPDWDWVHPDYDDALNMALSVLDRNGAFVSAISSAQFAHGALDHTGPLPYGTKAPGYYRIDWHPWQDPRIPSPLGSADLSGKVWVAAPTVEQLTQLCESGHWPDVRIHDSWTSQATVRFRKWATAVNVDRVERLRAVHADPDHQAELGAGSTQCPCPSCPWYKAVKDGYAMAVQMMLGPGANGPKSDVRRPDWYHTILAQHAATTWRYVWQTLQAGYEPVAMGGTDEVTYPSEALPAILTGGTLKLDASGEQLGTFKTKHLIPAATRG